MTKDNQEDETSGKLSVHSPSVTLRKICESNAREIFELRPKEDQPMYPNGCQRELFNSRHYLYWCRAIYADELLVGCIVVNLELEDDYIPWLTSLLIDEKYQGLGYGKKALELLFGLLKKSMKFLSTSTRVKNGPMDFYLKLGFQRTGELNDEKGDHEVLIKYF
jgi:diamine N-acetyltransferase